MTDPCRDKACGEPLAVKIVGEFKELYEGKLNRINDEVGDNPVGALEAKVAVQQSWIKDLSEQNDLLVHTVAELEQEASDRVSKLEKKLESSAQTGGEVMRKYRDFDISINLDATFQTLAYLQSDIRNLLEFIRRVRDDNIWCIDGLDFYEVTCEDLFGPMLNNRGMGDQNGPIPSVMPTDSDPSKQLRVMYEVSESSFRMGDETESECLCNNPGCPKELKILTIECPFNSKFDVVFSNEDECEFNDSVNAPIDHEIEEKEQRLVKQIEEKDDEMKQLKRSMIDMRNALTIEVAEKHDSILSLQKDMHKLEEQWRQANKQTQFRDDIIKELRKEIKQLKGQISSPQILSCDSKLFKPLETTYHKCCPIVRDSCPPTARNKHCLKSKPKVKKPCNVPAISVQSPLNEEIEINAKVTVSSKSLSAQKSAHQVQETPEKLTKVTSEKCSVNRVKSHSQQKSVLLTSDTILHECYIEDKVKNCGIVESFTNSPRKMIDSPRNDFAKAVNNLEKMVQSKSKQGVKND